MRSPCTHWLVVLALSACTGTPEPPPADPVEVSPPVDTDTRADAAPPPLSVASAAPTEPRYAATHVLIAWSGAAGAPSAITRTQAEALELATSLHGQVLAGKDIEQLARTHSDGPSAPRGGQLGVYATGTMVPDFERAVASVAVGKLAPLVQSPFGYHVVRRDAVVEAQLQHIQIAFAGTWRSDSTRTAEDARQRAEEALQALRDGTPFEDVARAFSDDPSASLNGGDLGLVSPGQLVPAFEQAAFALEPGQLSDIVETRYGLHVIRRTR